LDVFILVSMLSTARYAGVTTDCETPARGIVPTTKQPDTRDFPRNRSAKTRETQMRSTIYWIEAAAKGRLGIMARPRSGDWLDDEIAGWEAAGINTIVSLLERDEVNELGLGDEEKLCRRHGMTFISFPIPDRGVPRTEGETEILARNIALKLKDGTTVAIHCRAGIGRSSLIAACALVCSGLDAGSAFEAISKARGIKVPDTDEQRSWVTRFGKAV
jgi:protein-tyrosine phosphatase